VWFGVEPWPPKDFFTIFSIQDGLSCHYNIVLLWIKKWKILNSFNLESIIVHLVMLLMFFWYMRLNSQSESGKWWSSLQGREEVDGGIRHSGEFTSSAELRPHGPWRTGEIRAPVLHQTLALYSYMTFENAKVATVGKKYFFFIKLKSQQKNFWYRNRWERNPKLQVLRTKHLKQSFPGFAAVNKINNDCKVNFVDNVLLSVQKGQVVHFSCAMEESKTFDSLHMTEDSFSCNSGIL